jgi:hypothetical protein
MAIEMTTRIIQLILAPVVMVSASAIVLSGLWSHYGAINDRLRAMARERLALLKATAGQAEGTFNAERLGEIDGQIPDLLRRHTLMRNAILLVYWASAIFIANMFVIAWAAVSTADWLAAVTLLTFLAGLGALLLGILLTTFEVHISHRAVQYEVKRVTNIHPL